MFSVNVFVCKEKRKRIGYMCLITYLLISTIIFSGCKKSREIDITVLSGEELNTINNKLKEYIFTKQHFVEEDKLWDFLQELASLHYDLYPLVASGGTLWSVKQEDISSWLRGKEKSEEVFRKLCPFPQLTLRADKWEIVFNVFTREGGVDKWKVKGNYYPEKNNQIEEIEIYTLKSKGTFLCPLVG